MERILNVAVATDTILYSPFYTAWFGGDFENTPYKNVRVNVIARENDPFFRNDIIENLKAVDGFVTLCLVFGYADVGICDPAFIIQACKTDNNDLLKTSFNEFFSVLSDLERISFKESHSNLFHDNEIVVTKLRENIINKTIKLVGGLISRVAFSLIGNQTIAEIAATEAKPYVGQIHFGDNLKTFAKSKIKNLMCLPEPSTGHCVGATLRNAFGVGQAMPASHKTEFGREIDQILRLDDSKVNNTLAFTCDFVSLDYINANGIDVYEKDGNGKVIMEEKKDSEGITFKDQDAGKPVMQPKIFKAHQKIFEIEDWTMSEKKTAMFTGILALNPHSEKKDLIQAFLYGIDKNLYQIDKTIAKGKISLSNFFKSKLLTKHPKSDVRTLMKLLIAHPEIEEHCNIDDLIYYYVNRLTRWKKENSSLYYETVTPKIEDLKEIYRIRLSGYSQPSNTNEVDFNSFVDSTLLNDWQQEEKEINQYKSTKWKRFIWSLFTDENKLLYFGAAFITLEIIAILLKLTGYHIVELKIKGVWNWVAVGIFILICYGTWRTVLYGKHINHLKQKEEYLFRN